MMHARARPRRSPSSDAPLASFDHRRDADLAPLEAVHDRVMICGSPALLHDTRELLLGKGFIEGNHGEPGQFVVEKAFVER